jgi:hypothetical protein
MTETTAFTLACRDGHGQPPVLRDVRAAGRLDGTLFELTLRQTYRNAGTQLLEVVYTFPLLPPAWTAPSCRAARPSRPMKARSPRAPHP